MAQASAIATLEQIAPGRLMVGFGTGFTGRAGMGKKPLVTGSSGDAPTDLFNLPAARRESRHSSTRSS
jgi:alkanesulfonate monooxygenase SsuD/methylene tetrahydromethanopterin reductase-like flavin-dependent oxidoreductase (luciferase family)